MDCCFSSVIGLCALGRIFLHLGNIFCVLAHIWLLVAFPLRWWRGHWLWAQLLALCICIFSLSVSKAGRGSLLWSSYKDTSEGGTLWDPLATKMQLQSKADFYAALVSLANLQQVAPGDKRMTQVLDPEYCFSTTLVIYEVSFMAHTWEAFTSLWDWGCVGDEIPTWISKGGREIPDSTWREEDWGCGHCSWLCLFMPILDSSVNSQRVHVFFFFLGSCLGEKVKMNLALVFAV